MNLRRKENMKLKLKNNFIATGINFLHSRIRFRLSAGEFKVYRKRKPIKPSVWAERHRVITVGPLAGGRWKNDFISYLKGILDASFFPSVRVIIHCKVPQTGGSAVLDTCLAYAMDRRPGTALMVYPDEKTCRDNSKDRLMPMIKASPRLRSLLTGVDDDLAALRIKLQTMAVYMGWAGSATSLGNKSCMYLVLDEIDKYVSSPNKKEANSLDLARKRVTAYPHNHKIWKTSTPTIETGAIWQALTTEAQVTFDFFVTCPACKKLQLMEFDSIKWPDDERDPERVENEKLAWYQCECGDKWTDHDRDKAVRTGMWIARNDGRKLNTYLQVERPRKIGFHTPAWLSPFVSLSEVAAAFLYGLKDKNKLKDFMNSYKAEPWIMYTRDRPEDTVRALRDDRPRGLVPGNGIVAAITAGVDTQDDGFFYTIRAWGYGLTQESWLIREGFVTSKAGLAQVLFVDKYLDAAGSEYVVRIVVQDAMGHRTAEVYDFSRLYPGLLFPLKGAGQKNNPITWSIIDFYPGTKKQIPGGVRLLSADVGFFKNSLTGKMEISQSDPGAWHLHREITEEFIRHMTAEYVDDNGKWQVKGSRPQHYWDCSVYDLIAAEILQVKFWPRPKSDRQQPAMRRVVSKGVE